MQILGSWQAAYQFDSLALVADFLVSGVRFGFNFLSKYSAVVDLGNETWRTMGKTFPLVDLKPTSEPWTVVHLETVGVRYNFRHGPKGLGGTTQREC